MAFLKDGISLSDVMKCGSSFEIESDIIENNDTDSVSDKSKYLKEIRQFLAMDCLGDEEQIDLSSEPFERLSKRMFPLPNNRNIKKQILRKGYGEIPTESVKVKLDYNAYTEFEAIPFDSTYARKSPLILNMNGDGIVGFELAVKSMQINEKSRFLIPSHLAYKDSGLVRIPTNSTILFEIEIHNTIVNLPSQSKEFQDVYEYGIAACQQAKELFKCENYNGAINLYKNALYKVEDSHLSDDNDQEKYDDLMCRLHTNLLVCYTKLKIPKKGCIHANSILRLARNGNIRITSKVLFNNALCLMLLDEFEAAQKKLKWAFRIDPDNKFVQKKLEYIQQVLNRE